VTDDPIDGARILAEARALSYPRYPGTEGDRRAIAEIADRLRQAGLETSVEQFSYDLRPALWSLRTLLIAAGLLLAAAGAVGRTAPQVGLVLVALALAPAAVFLTWAPWLERLYRRDGPTRTANVSGRRPVPSPRLTLIVMAHHDSKSQNLPLPWRATATFAALGGSVGLAGVLVAGLGRAAPPGPGWLAPALGGLAGAAALVLSTLSNGNRSPGAVDNAGAVALVLELAAALTRELPADVELIALSTGAEEDHMIGALRWLDAHAAAFAGRSVYCLNFDGVGAPGRVVLLDRYGALRPCAPTLTPLALAAAASLGVRPRRVVTPPALGTDAIPFVHRGVECLTFASGSLGRATMAVHSAGDVPGNLDREPLEQAARVARAVALQLAGEPHRR
jgi:hypothetical protein